MTKDRAGRSILRAQVERLERRLGALTALALNSARAYETQRAEAWVSTVILQVAEATGQAVSLEEVLETAVRVTAMLAGVESTIIWLWHEEYEAFLAGASFGLRKFTTKTQRTRDLRFGMGEWPALDEVRETRGAVVLDRVAEPDRLPVGYGEVCPGELVALLPMLVRGEVLGVLAAGFDRAAGAGLNSVQGGIRRQTSEVFETSEVYGGRFRPGSSIDQRRLAMLEGIARQIAAPVANSRLATMAEEEVWTSTVLLQVAEAIRRLQPVDMTLEQVTRIASALTGVDRCVALLVDQEGNFRARTVHAKRPALVQAYQGAVIQPDELPLLADVCRTGQPLAVDDAQDNPRVPAAWRERFGSRTILVVPLLVADEPIGALLADDVDRSHTFSPRRVRVLAGIANQAAIAIENARLQIQEAERARLGRELELAHDIQKTLLPQEAPGLDGYEVAYRWQAAAEVGGDFCDFIHLDPARLGLVIADVSGKGIPAALYMMFARTILRVVSFSGRDPALALQHANTLIISESTSDMFVTAHYGVLDIVAHQLTYSSAGHNLALHAPAAGAPAVPLRTDGLALGIIEDVNFEQKTVDLDPGDVVLFYTDGAIDTLNPAGDAFGEERLAELLRQYQDEPAEDIAAAIDAAVRTWAAGESQYDDFTLIVIKRKTMEREGGIR